MKRAIFFLIIFITAQMPNIANGSENNYHIINPNKTYTYDALIEDLFKLNDNYSDIIDLEIIGQSVLGRDIYAIKLGRGDNEIVIVGAHHAREHITVNLIMKMIDEYAYLYYTNGVVDDFDVATVLDNTSIYFIPMLNTDGVMLSIEGLASVSDSDDVYIMNRSSYDFSSWKANINGVDLNRQYPADWYNIRNNPSKAGPANYKGDEPLSEPEAHALYDFTLKHNFRAAVSYHSSGEIIYWYFNQGKTDYKKHLKLTNELCEYTGYDIVAAEENPSGGGYTDWFIQAENAPGVTIEVSTYVGDTFVPLEYLEDIWNKNKAVGLLMADYDDAYSVDNYLAAAIIIGALTVLLALNKLCNRHEWQKC